MSETVYTLLPDTTSESLSRVDTAQYLTQSNDN
jgi:hypothetical protein